MPQFTYSANMLSPDYPFLSTQKSRCVIVPQSDQDYVPGASGDGNNRGKSVADAYYLENMIATEYGYTAPKFVYPSTNTWSIPASEQILDTYVLDSGAANNYRILLTIDTSANSIKAYYLDINTGWVLFSTIGSYFSGRTNFIGDLASVNGTNYLLIYGKGVYTITLGGGGEPTALTLATLSGVVASDIKCMTTAYGYLLISDGTNIYWSSTLDPTDFVPSLITGAGGGAVQGLLGTIQQMVPIYEGFIIYSTLCIISAKYSGNARYPFIFELLPGAGGISYRPFYYGSTVGAKVAYSNNANQHFAFTSVGFQVVTVSDTAVEFAALGTHLNKHVIERLNTATGQTYQTGPINYFGNRYVTDVSVSVIASRYVVVSQYRQFFIGITATESTGNVTCCYIYDLELKRWSRLVIDGTHVVIPLTGKADNVEQLAFLNMNTGAVVLCLMTGTSNTSLYPSVTTFATSSIIFGPYQYVRTNKLQLQYVDVELADAASTYPTCRILSSPTGSGQSEIVLNSPSLLTAVSGILRAYFNSVATNHRVLCYGSSFSLTGITLTGSPHGRR